MVQELYYVTGNAGKFKEVDEFLKRSGSSVELKQVALELEEIQTLDHRGIAIRKAQQAWAQVRKPLLVDDAGIYFEQYHRFPGTLTKFVYEGIGWNGILKLVQDDHRATFLLYLVYIDGLDSYQVFEGKCSGKIVSPMQFLAQPGLPYDDLFIPDGADKTYAQMWGTQEIDRYAYRLLALQKFLDWYKTR